MGRLKGDATRFRGRKHKPQGFLFSLSLSLSLFSAIKALKRTLSSWVVDDDADRGVNSHADFCHTEFRHLQR